MDCQTIAPRILQNNSEQERVEIERLRSSLGIRVVDELQDFIESAFSLEFPYLSKADDQYESTLREYVGNYWNESQTRDKTVWAYYDWNNTLVRLPAEDIFFALRTARNRHLITEEEQSSFHDSRIGIAGLSVGSHILNAVVLSGGPRHIRVADFDHISITNINRLFCSVTDLGENKTTLAARRIWGLNPFQELELFDCGLDMDNIEQFMGTGDSRLDVFIEEMDNIRMKGLARLKARELKIPVVMATDNGDNAIIDVERFDLEPDRPIFHGTVNESMFLDMGETLTLPDKIRLANAIVGPDVTPRMQLSLVAVGSELPAWPQLGNAAVLSGVAVSYVVRRIILGEDMPSGRYRVCLDSSLDPSYHSEAAKEYRTQQKEEFISGFNLIFAEDM